MDPAHGEGPLGCLEQVTLAIEGDQVVFIGPDREAPDAPEEVDASEDLEVDVASAADGSAARACSDCGRSSARSGSALDTSNACSPAAGGRAEGDGLSIAERRPHTHVSW